MRSGLNFHFFDPRFGRVISPIVGGLDAHDKDFLFKVG